MLLSYKKSLSSKDSVSLLLIIIACLIAINYSNSYAISYKFKDVLNEIELNERARKSKSSKDSRKLLTRNNVLDEELAGNSFLSNERLQLYFNEKNSSVWKFLYDVDNGLWGESCYHEHFAIWTSELGIIESDSFTVVDPFIDLEGNFGTIRTELIFEDITIERKITLPPGNQPFFEIRYKIINTGNKKYTDIRFFEAIDFDIPTTSDRENDYGEYEENSDYIRIKDDNFFRNGMESNFPSTKHGIDYWSTQLYDDWDDGNLNNNNEYGPADIAMAKQFNIGSLSPTQSSQEIVLKIWFGEPTADLIPRPKGLLLAPKPEFKNNDHYDRKKSLDNNQHYLRNFAIDTLGYERGKAYYLYVVMPSNYSDENQYKPKLSYEIGEFKNQTIVYTTEVDISERVTGDDNNEITFEELKLFSFQSNSLWAQWFYSLLNKLFINNENLNLNGNEKIKTYLINIPSDFPVGWARINVELKQIDGSTNPTVPNSQKKYQFGIIFNPFINWNNYNYKYMLTDNQLKHYVLGETELINGINFTLDPNSKITFHHCMDNISTLNIDSRRNIKKVATHLSKSTNSKFPGGIMTGKWFANNYAGGTNPSHWNNVKDIIDEFNTNKAPVKYAQCWVFSALTNALLRSCGIPSRTIEVGGAGHDKLPPYDKLINIKHKKKDKYLEYERWGFHAWNEIFIEALKITDNTLNQLISMNIPSEMITKLETIKNVEFFSISQIYSKLNDLIATNSQYINIVIENLEGNYVEGTNENWSIIDGTYGFDYSPYKSLVRKQNSDDGGLTRSNSLVNTARFVYEECFLPYESYIIYTSPRGQEHTITQHSKFRQKTSTYIMTSIVPSNSVSGDPQFSDIYSSYGTNRKKTNTTFSEMNSEVNKIKCSTLLPKKNFYYGEDIQIGIYFENNDNDYINAFFEIFVDYDNSESTAFTPTVETILSDNQTFSLTENESINFSITVTPDNYDRFGEYTISVVYSVGDEFMLLQDSFEINGFPNSILLEDIINKNDTFSIELTITNTSLNSIDQVNLIAGIDKDYFATNDPLSLNNVILNKGPNTFIWNVIAEKGGTYSFNCIIDIMSKGNMSVSKLLKVNDEDLSVYIIPNAPAVTNSNFTLKAMVRNSGIKSTDAVATLNVNEELIVIGDSSIVINGISPKEEIEISWTLNANAPGVFLANILLVDTNNNIIASSTSIDIYSYSHQIEINSNKSTIPIHKQSSFNLILNNFGDQDDEISIDMFTPTSVSLSLYDNNIPIINNSIVVSSNNSKSLTCIATPYNVTQSDLIVTFVAKSLLDPNAKDHVSLSFHEPSLPSANAGKDQYVYPNETVFLDASNSTDLDSNIVSYTWKQIEGINVSLSNSESITASFISPIVQKETSLIFQLTVTNNESLSATDTCKITVKPQEIEDDDSSKYCFISICSPDSLLNNIWYYFVEGYLNKEGT